MLIPIHPDNPHQRQVQIVVDILRKGGVIIYPTDTIYGLGCDIFNTKAVERLCQIKQIANPSKANFSFVCSDLNNISEYTKSISKPIFRLLKNSLPGPFTFILEASKQVPKILKNKKDTIGIRVPKHPITHALIKELGHPIISTSLPIGDFIEYYTDPEVIYELFQKQVDCVVDGGTGGMEPSTVIDCTGGEPVLIRAGAGSWEEINTK